MKNIGSMAKRWSFLLAFMACGIFYLAVMDGWRVYGKELDKVKALYEKRYDSGNGFLNGRNGMGLLEETLAPSDLQQPSCEEAEDVELEDGIYRAVEDDYFADAVFIGDSRTVGMFEYGGLEDISTFYASKGLTIYKLFDAQIVGVAGKKQKITIEEALSNRQFAKIYLMVGINEMGTGTVDSFLAKYKEAVEHLQELQPDAIIYIQGIIKVTAKRSGEGDYITNEGIEARNQGLELLADNARVYYLDVNPLICDETGGMVDSYTYDGVHLKAQYIPIWKDFLKSHAVKGQ